MTANGAVNQAYSFREIGLLRNHSRMSQSCGDILECDHMFIVKTVSHYVALNDERYNNLFDVNSQQSLHHHYQNRNYESECRY